MQQALYSLSYPLLDPLPQFVIQPRMNFPSSSVSRHYCQVSSPPPFSHQMVPSVSSPPFSLGIISRGFMVTGVDCSACSLFVCLLCRFPHRVELSSSGVGEVPPRSTLCHPHSHPVCGLELSHFERDQLAHTS